MDGLFIDVVVALGEETCSVAEKRHERLHLLATICTSLGRNLQCFGFVMQLIATLRNGRVETQLILNFKKF